LLSGNALHLPLNIECFMNNADVSRTMNRRKLLKMCNYLLSSVEPPLHAILEQAQLKKEDMVSYDFEAQTQSVTSKRGATEQNGPVDGQGASPGPQAAEQGSDTTLPSDADKKLPEMDID
jgi:hypothetical protein